MTRKEWEEYRRAMNFAQHIGEVVRILWHWNFGTSRSKRARESQGKLDYVDSRGIALENQRLRSYKCVDQVIFNEAR